MPVNDTPSARIQNSGSSELQSAQHLRDKLYPKMAETSVVVDLCSENQMCSSNRQYISDSKSSLHPCTCGPNCSPEKCTGRKNTSLVSWDETRTKIFLLLIAAFAIWILVYVPISVTGMNSSEQQPE